MTRINIRSAVNEEMVVVFKSSRTQWPSMAPTLKIDSPIERLDSFRTLEDSE